MKLTTDHPQSSYGLPVLVGEVGQAYGPADILPSGEGAADYAKTNLADDPLLERFLMPLEPLQGQGGPGRGQGRKPADPKFKKVNRSVRLPQWLWDEIDKMAGSRGEVIEAAVLKQYKLSPE